jgi:hypothetical protein
MKTAEHLGGQNAIKNVLHTVAASACTPTCECILGDLLLVYYSAVR